MSKTPIITNTTNFVTSTQLTAAPGTAAEAEVAAKAKATPAAANAPANAATANGDATAAAPATGASAEAEANTTQPAKHFNAEVASNTQVISGHEADTNQTTIAAQANLQRGPWRFEMNGTGLVNSLLGPKSQHSVGQFNDYVFQLRREKAEQRWGGEMRFGIIAPQMVLNAEFITTAIPREGFEGALKTPFGKFSAFIARRDAELRFARERRDEPGQHERPARR